jgi:hypothetical protein
MGEFGYTHGDRKMTAFGQVWDYKTACITQRPANFSMCSGHQIHQLIIQNFIGIVLFT